MRLGLLGGSFNPIHHGHLITATRAAEAVKLDRVLFIPAAFSPLKDWRDLAPDRDRWAMLRLALRGNERFAPCDLELRRGGVSYSVDTLRDLRRTTDAPLYWILGADAARLLPRWKSIREVRRLASFVIVTRPGDRLPAKMPKDRMVKAPLLEISSNEIRDRIRRGLSVRYLMPEAVERYIRRKGLYRR
ncbi:MAG: nicotinate (nicotinamide) nucleotide adenylyltransferase [Planctomycetes bacterium]|nr:nicotinate (nicotinamide) nucleotide adenylyltransferase [Planctomycetota bacterium]